MPFTRFFELFPEVASKETRSITLLRARGLPDGSYGFVELFCNEDECDCRRAFIYVVLDQTTPSVSPEPLATISFGWEDKAFYRNWASFPLSRKDLNELKGPALVSTVSQSKYAPALLRQFKTLIQNDAYVARIVRHYQMFRDAIEDEKSKPALSAVRSQAKIGRNQPCPCGSGKKYKKCCEGNLESLSADDSKADPKTQRRLVLTTTGELFQRVRLFYELTDRSEMESSFSKLACMDFDPNEDR